MRLFLLSALLAPASSWNVITTGSRFNVGNHDPPITCGGAIMTEQIAKNVRGENPDVPVSLYARFPMRNPLAWWLSYIHVWSANVLLVVLIINFFGPKGSDKNPSKVAFHKSVGRIVVYGITPHYVLIGCVLNYLAITVPLQDWLLAPPLSDWRMQTAYIWPFAMNIFVAFNMGFFLMRYKFMPQKWAKFLKYCCVFNITFWFTIGLAMMLPQALGFGLGNLGLWDTANSVPGGGEGLGQPFWQPLTFVICAVGSMQAGQDFVSYKVLSIVEKTGNEELAWKNMHKWAMVDLMWQAAVIFGFFLSYFPFCLYGFPEWTCLYTPFFAVPLISVLSTPLLPQAIWIYSFLKSIFGVKLIGEPPMSVAKFSEDDHAWDGIGPFSEPKAML